MPRKPAREAGPPAPWAAFLEELDGVLPEPVEVHCVGGFVLTVLYGVPRVTSDLDYVSVLPQHNLGAVAGPDSPMARKHGVFLQYVGVNAMPENYASRLAELFPGRFAQLRLFAPDPYDLILSKLERNSPKDREDVQYLANRLRLSPETFAERYRDELRPYLANELRHDLTLQMWASLFPAAEA